MTRNAQGDLRLATYERIIGGLLALISTASLAVSAWCLTTVIKHDTAIAVLQSQTADLRARLAHTQDAAP